MIGDNVPDIDYREFFARVLPWPVETSPGMYAGVVNLHWTIPAPSGRGKPIWVGKPARTQKGFFDLLDWVKTRDTTRDVYFCLSQQAASGKNKKGNETAVRLAENATFLKAIWLDLDVKDKDYASTSDALDDLQKFRTEYHLPAPSALVGSGGGVHVYWISDKPLTVKEWTPYAEGLKAAAMRYGLKADLGCTSDCARILRVPNTFNHKSDPPKPTKLLGLGKDYDFATDLAALPVIAPIVTATVTSKKDVNFDLTNFPKKFEPVESLAEGLHSEYPPLAAQPIMKGCAFMRTALITGGKDYDQPLWNLTTLAATFIENGEKLAHSLGNKHLGYSADSTKELYERKVRERDKKGVGWPKCRTIHANGFAGCSTCPLFGAGKSPLHLGMAPQGSPPPSIPGHGKSRPHNLPEGDLNLPDGFFLDEAGYICRLIKGGKNEPDYPVRLFKKILSKPWTQSNPYALHFTTTRDKGVTSPVVLYEKDVGSSQAIFDELVKQGVLINVPEAKPFIEEFIVSWLSKWHEVMKATEAHPFGWWKEAQAGKESKVHGFVYGGRLYKDDGTDQMAGYAKPGLRHVFQPCGTIGPWLKACKMVTDRKRPEFDAIIASAFASPLMIVPAENSVLLSVYGESGSGKSTAVKVAMGVWQHPKYKEISISTMRSAITKMGELRNLPIYWDEISVKAQQTVFEAFMIASEGIDGSRLTPELEYRARGHWQNMMIVTENHSFVDKVVSQHKATDAGMFRVFEFVADKKPGPGQLTTMEASTITQAMEDNFGNMGVAYAKYLGNNPVEADAFTRKIVEDLAKEVKQENEERYWPALVGTLIAGAEFANRLGAELDIPAMRKFLIEQYYENRKRVAKEFKRGGSAGNTTSILNGFLQTYNLNTLYTTTYPMGAGRPGVITVVDGPPLERKIPIYVQWTTEEYKLRISKRVLLEYLNKEEIPVSPVMNGLRDHYHADTVEGTLAKGTKYRTQLGKEYLVVIDVPKGSDMEAQMLSHSQQTDIDVGAKPPLAIEQAQADLDLVRSKT